MERALREPVPDDMTLLEALRRTGATGPGVRYLQRKGKPSQALMAFLADGRLAVPMASRMRKKESMDRRGKTLRYEKESKEIREALDISRMTEWTKWKDFVAGRPCMGQGTPRAVGRGPQTDSHDPGRHGPQPA